MDDTNYNQDKLEIIQQKQIQAQEELNIIEKRSELTHIAFLKENYNSRKISERKHDSGFNILLAMSISKICGFTGIKNDISNFDSQDITKMILSVYNQLSIEELYKAFELERYGVYEDKTDHFQLFNAEYVSVILKKYLKWKQNTRIQHNISPPMEVPQQTESEKKEIVNNGIIRVFNEFKDSGIMPEPNNYIFDELLDRGIIKKPDTDSLLLYYIKKRGEAEKEIVEELKEDKSISNYHNKNHIKAEFENIVNKNSDKVLARTKKLILIDYFNKLISENKDIKTIINI